MKGARGAVYRSQLTAYRCILSARIGIGLECRQIHERLRFPAWLAMFGYDIGEDAAAHVEFCRQPHETGCGGCNQVVQDMVGDGLMECALVAKGPDVEFQAFQFDALLIRDVIQIQGGEIGLSGFRAQTGKFGNFHVDMKIPLRVRVAEGFQDFAGLAGHYRAFVKSVKITLL